MEHRISRNSKDKVLRCFIDPCDNRIITVNGDWRELTGYSQEEVIGHDFLKYFKHHYFPTKSNTDRIIKTKNGDLLLNWDFDYEASIGAFIAKGTLKKQA
jgi:PAS domain-containing protein